MFDGCGQLSISVAHLKDISMPIILRLEVRKKTHVRQGHNQKKKIAKNGCILPYLTNSCYSTPINSAC